jgi:photosystem II stability/assembly factor-like uncharacterized protein
MTATIVRKVLVKDSRLFALTTTGVFKSENNGSNWVAASNGLSGNALNVLTGVQKEGIMFIGTNANGIFRSSDNGSTWTPVNNGLSGNGLIVNALIVNGSIIYAGTSSGVYKSSDSGASWKPYNTGLSGNAIAIRSLMVLDQNIFAATGAGVFYSSDNAETWTQMNSGLTGYNLNIASLAANDSYIFAGTQYKGVWRHFISDKNLSVSSTVLTMDYWENSTADFTITSNTGWSISSSAAWLSVNPTSGTLNGNIMLTAQANPLTSSRIAMVTVSGTDVLPVTVTVTQQGSTTDISELSATEISIYPNPARNTLNFSGLVNSAEVSVYNLQGSLIFRHQLSGNSLDVSNLKTGMYFIKIDSETETTLRRFVKQ